MHGGALRREDECAAVALQGFAGPAEIAQRSPKVVERFDEARRDLFDFSARFDQGRYEKKELDHAIDRIQNVVSHNSLDPRDRGSLDEDLRRMRDFRAWRDNRVYRDYGYR